jgi:hypothetical protein
MRPWSKQWFDDCMHWRGKVLEGRYRHWCFDWDELPVDETTGEFPCGCFSCKCGILMVPTKLGEGALHLFDDYFECPKRRFWNFWKHDFWGTTLEGDKQ